MLRKWAAVLAVCLFGALAWLGLRHPSTGAEKPLQTAAEAELQPVRTAYESAVPILVEPIPSQPLPEVVQTAAVTAEAAVEPPPAEAWLEVPLVSQLPELYNGCEVTSLAMLLDYVGQPADKLELAERVKRDETPPAYDEDGNLAVWGDPDKGFVGDIFGNDLGYGVYVKPLAELLSQVYAPGALDLSGREFEDVERAVAGGKPVLIWTIASFEPSDDWITWRTPEGKDVTATFQEHCVLVIGYDEDYVYVNNPFENLQGQQVPKGPFLEAWDQMGRMALTVQDGV